MLVWATYNVRTASLTSGVPGLRRLAGAALRAPAAAALAARRLRRRAAAVLAGAGGGASRPPPPAPGAPALAPLPDSLVAAEVLPRLDPLDLASCAAAGAALRRLASDPALLAHLDFDRGARDAPRRVTAAALAGLTARAGGALRSLSLATAAAMPVGDVLRALLAAPGLAALATSTAEPPGAAVAVVCNTRSRALHDLQPVWSAHALARLRTQCPALGAFHGCVAGRPAELAAAVAALPPRGRVRLACECHPWLALDRPARRGRRAPRRADGARQRRRRRRRRRCRPNAEPQPEVCGAVPLLGQPAPARRLPRCPALVSLTLVDRPDKGVGAHSAAALAAAAHGRLPPLRPLQLDIAERDPEDEP